MGDAEFKYDYENDENTFRYYEPIEIESVLVLYAIAIDARGNLSEMITLTFDIDTSIPDLNIGLISTPAVSADIGTGSASTATISWQSDQLGDYRFLLGDLGEQGIGKYLLDGLLRELTTRLLSQPQITYL